MKNKNDDDEDEDGALIKARVHQVYNNVDCIVIAFDLTNFESYKNAETWYERFYTLEMAPVVLIGTKSDLKQQRQVSKIEILMQASKYNVDYIETSSSDAISTDLSFRLIIDKLARKMMFQPSSGSSQSTGNLLGISSLPTTSPSKPQSVPARKKYMFTLQDLTEQLIKANLVKIKKAPELF